MVGTRREQRIGDAKQRAVQAAWVLLRDRSWDEITVTDICARADIAVRTFHRYFPDKTEVFFSDASRHEEALRAAVAAAPFDAGRPRAFIDAVVAAMAAEFTTYPRSDLRRRETVIAASPELTARDLVKRARLAAIITDDLASRWGEEQRPRAGVLVDASLRAFTSAVTTWAEDGGDLPGIVTSSLDRLVDDLR